MKRRRTKWAGVAPKPDRPAGGRRLGRFRGGRLDRRLGQAFEGGGIGIELGVSAEEGTKALSNVKLPKLRGEWVQYGDLRVLADQLDARIQIHLHESAEEVRQSLQSTGKRME